MDYGFLARVRCFTRLDHQLLKCVETRYYHEFGWRHILRERKYYHDPYLTFFAVPASCCPPPSHAQLIIPSHAAG